MHRVVLILVALAFATGAAAEPFENLKPGASGAEAKRILGAEVEQESFDGGYALAGRRPDGRTLSADICTKGGREVVSAVNEIFGRALPAFTAEVSETTRRLGEPQWTASTPPPSSGVTGFVEAAWQTPEGRLSVSMIQFGPQLQVVRDLRRPCV